jgi:hypothetical protein
MMQPYLKINIQSVLLVDMPLQLEDVIKYQRIS